MVVTYVIWTWIVRSGERVGDRLELDLKLELTVLDVIDRLNKEIITGMPPKPKINTKITPQT